MRRKVYGYEIKNGSLIVNEKQADIIRSICKNYLAGMPLMKAAEEAGMKLTHSSVKNIINNRRYLGDESYPAILDKATFEQVQEERIRREKALGRDNKPKRPMAEIRIPTQFSIKRVRRKYDDPVRQAEYAYSMIQTVEG